MNRLLVALERVRRRLSVQQWIRLAVMASFISSSVACIWLIFTKCFPVLGDPALVLFGLLGAGIVAATVLAILRRPSLVGAALEADDRLGLNERLTSSYELADVPGPMVDAVHRDANARLDGIDPRIAFPYVLPRSARWLATALVLFGLAYTLLPEFDLLHHREREAEAFARSEAVRVRAEKLRAAVRPLKDLSGDSAATLMEAATSIERISETLEQQEIDDKQALAKLSNLSKEMAKQREQLKKSNPMPKLAGDVAKLGTSRDMAKDIQNGRFNDAAQKARELAKKMESGDLSEKEKEKLAKDLKELSEMLGGKDSELGEALAKASTSLSSGDMNSAMMSMNAMKLSLEDMASVMEQLGMLNMAMANLSKWQQDGLGPSKFCRICGTPLKPCGIGNCKGCGPGSSCSGTCGGCAGIGGMWAQGQFGQGGGMGRGGMGRGGQTGELPDISGTFKPTVAPGPLTKGKVLADILQKAAPDEDVDATADYISGAFIQIQQEAEQALTKEEIPPGSKEFVRHYFGSLEPDDRAQLEDSSSIPR